MSDADLARHVRDFIELAAYNAFDGQLHISHFRSLHGGELTLAILRAVLDELRSPSKPLNLYDTPRADLVAWFEHQLERHRGLRDEDFRYPKA